MPEHEPKKYETRTDFVRDKGSAIAYPLVKMLGSLGIHPNVVTLVGFLLNIVAGIVIATGNHVAGGVLVIIASSVDGLDGALARVSGKKTRFGAFLDSTLDRISEGALFFGLMVWLASQNMMVDIYLVYFVVLGSIMVSYARARAEGLGFECKVGILTRLERIIVLSVGLLFGWIRVTLIIMVVFTWVTFFQRTFSVYKVALKQEMESH